MWHATYPQLWFTYGPKTKDSETIKQLLIAGATGARLTFSYGDPDLQAQRAAQLRSVASQLGKAVFLVADLQGEKCRFSPIEGTDEIVVRKGDAILLSPNEVDPSLKPVMIQVQLPAYLDELRPGDVVVEGDGALLLEVSERQPHGVLCKTLSDGALHPGRGILLQRREFRPKALTEKDKADFAYILDSGLFDAVAVSFVGTQQDVIETKRLMSSFKTQISVVAKIETELGIENIEAIVAEADAVMAARGDLALTMPWEELPVSVATIARAANHAHKPWILATQIAEGMERFSFPTRAEICDLARWIEEQAFAVMLSYETAFGKTPVEAIGAVKRMLDRFARTSYV